MRSLLSRILGRFATSMYAQRSWLLLAPFLGVVAGALLLSGDHAAVEAQHYSAYSDPEKPAIAFILSEQRNAEEFQAEFGLDDEEMAKVLAAVRKENETLAREYGESERELEAESKGAVSEYNAAVREAVAKTKSTVEGLLPEDRIPRLGRWVDAKFAQEGREAAESAAADVVSTDRSRKLRCKVYATYYNGFTRYEVALPHRALKFRDRLRKVAIRPVSGGRRDGFRVKEVGPWNTFDDYWHWRTTNERRGEWRNLPRCVPEAQAAYFNNHNKGKDEFGRTVRNPAGVDLTLAVAKKLGIKSQLQRKGKVRVYVSFPWVKR